MMPSWEFGIQRQMYVLWGVSLMFFAEARRQKQKQLQLPTGARLSCPWRSPSLGTLVLQRASGSSLNIYRSLPSRGGSGRDGAPYTFCIAVTFTPACAHDGCCIVGRCRGAPALGAQQPELKSMIDNRKSRIQKWKRTKVP